MSFNNSVLIPSSEKAGYSMLTEEEKTKIRLEEVYRFEVQKDLTPDTKQKKWYQSVWSLLNSTFTIFFLSSIFSFP